MGESFDLQRSEACLKTLVDTFNAFNGDLPASEGVTIPDEDINEILTGKREQSSPDSIDGSLWGYFQAAANLIKGRCFFITNNGLVGIGPSDMQPYDQDEVHIIHGAETPFILRRCAVKEDEQDEHTSSTTEGEKSVYRGNYDGSGNRILYHVIGECYVHCLMNGEWLEGKDRSDPLSYMDRIELF